jgi:hypothetical protein
MLSRRICTFVFVAVPMIAGMAPRIVEAQGAPTQSQLAEISARGRALAAYQRAAWMASSQLVATNPDLTSFQRYVAYRADSGWVVAFGRMNSERDTFYVSNIAIPAAVKGQRVDSLFEFQRFTEPGPDTDFLVRAVRAMDLAVAALGRTTRAYSASAIPADKGDWFVYLTPAADVASVAPFGDDVRYRISADGERVLETHRMHVGLVEADRSAPEGAARLTAGRHRTALHDLPEDSDVYHVLTRRPQVPEVVTTRHYQYVIGVDGSIKLVQGKETLVGAAR